MFLSLSLHIYIYCDCCCYCNCYCDSIAIAVAVDVAVVCFLVSMLYVSAKLSSPLISAIMTWWSGTNFADARLTRQIIAHGAEESESSKDNESTSV